MWTEQQMIIKLNSSALASPSTKISLLGLTMTRLFIVSDQLCHDMLGRITVMVCLYI